MKVRALLLADGPSDVPLGQHVARIARRHSCDIDVVAPDLRRLDLSPGRRVASRLEAILRIDDSFDLVIVHRDSEGQDPTLRRAEVEAGVAAVRDNLATLPIVPVRMTEAWLLLDEQAIRRVAGRPTGREPLGLPAAVTAEAVPDPKALLRHALELASGASGRRLRRFKRDFPVQRRRLLEAVSHEGPVRQLSAWQALERDVADAVDRL